MTLSLPLVILMISAVALISANVSYGISGSMSFRYLIPALATSDDLCKETAETFDTESGRCVPDNSPSGGAGAGGCPPGEVSIDGQCTPEFETEGTCPSGMVHERGQGCVEPLGVPECTQGYDCPGDPAGPDRTETHPSKCEPGIQSCEWGCVAGMNCEGDPLNPVDTCDPDIQTCGVANPNQGHECERQPTRVEQEECIGSCPIQTLEHTAFCGLLIEVPPAAGGCELLAGIELADCLERCSLPKKALCW